MAAPATGLQRRAARFHGLPMAVVLGVLPACASYEPVALEPARELAALSRLVPSDAFDEGASFDLSDGADERELVAVALRLNPELRATRLAVGEAQALLITAGVWPNPEIGVSWRAAAGDAAGYQLDADMLFDLLVTGERSARKDAAAARIDGARARVVAAEWDLVSRVRGQTLEVLAGERLMVVLEGELALREEFLSLVRRRQELGEGTELDVATAELERAQLQRDVRLARASVAGARRGLNLMLGLPPGYALALSGSGQPVAATVVDDLAGEELDQRLLAGRFELRALEAAYQESEHALRAAVLAQYPHLRLGPAASHEGDEGNFFGLAVGLTLPIFDHNQGEIAERRAIRETRRAEYIALLHSLRAGAHDKAAQLRAARAELEAQQATLLPSLERASRLFERAFQARDIGILDWAAARQRAMEAQKGILDATIRYRRATIELEAAIGVSALKGSP
jgi:cobalt-zinc-cadmium efflux system outer membrane protein